MAVDPLPIVRWLHLMAAAAWTGGLVTLAALIVVLRRAGAERTLPWSYGRLHLKLAMVVVTVLLAGGHQFTARRSSPRVRGMIQLAILLASSGVFAAAVAL
jgi:putative copper export protein